MPTTSITTAPADLPFDLYPPLIEIKAEWSDTWQLCDGREGRLYLQYTGSRLCVSRSGFSEVSFMYKYGPKVLNPGQSDFASLDPIDLELYWVRISMYDYEVDVYTDQMVGRISSDGKTIKGNADETIGEQHWKAYCQVKTLMEIDINSSYWLDGGNEKKMDWLPAMNLRDARKMLVGNRSAAQGSKDTYLYGGKDIWTHYQYIEMILAYFVIQTDGPNFTIGGQASLLTAVQNLKTSIDFGNVNNVKQMLDKLLPREYGLDWQIVYLSDELGFELRIFGLLSAAGTFGGDTIPANDNIVTIDRGNQLDMDQLVIATGYENLVDKMLVVGSRVIICASLGAANAAVFQGCLIKGWTDALETLYKAGTGNPDDDSNFHDHARRNEKFKHVYQRFIAPTDWNYRTGTHDRGLAPEIGDDGAMTGEPAPYQNSVRKTLPFLPLLAGYNYTVNPATNDNVTDDVPEYLHPLAIIENEGFNEQNEPVTSGHMQCDLNGISVSTPHNDLGIQLHASPAHNLAKRHAFGVGSDEFLTTDFPNSDTPLYDYDTLVVTIAWQTDQRLKIAADVPSMYQKGDGTCKVIVVEDAELWILAPETVVGVKPEDATLLQSPNEYVILRDDTDRLKLTLAGEIARYLNPRVRSQNPFKGYVPWANLLGQILQVIGEAGSTTNIGAPITEIVHTPAADGGVSTTNISTGYA